MRFKYCKEGHLMDPSWKCCPVCLAPLAGWLIHLKEDKAFKVYTIHEGKSFVGSGADCEIRILNADLSRRQAYLIITDGMCTISDMGNNEIPLKVNNGDVTKSALIDGDIIKFGDSTFKIKLL